MTNKEMIYPSRFRWQLHSKTFPEFSTYVAQVRHDYLSKSVKAVALDAVVGGKPVVHDWISRSIKEIKDDELTIYQFDENGNQIYAKVLKGAKIVGHSCNHDYECDGDDLQDHELIFTYEELQTA